MAELQAAKKTVLELLGNEKASFHIPSYQRPYAWGIDECETLWDDICGFIAPNENPDNFVSGSEYFLGPLVTYKGDESGDYEVIDGQQRLTTLMLLLRVLHSKLETMNSDEITSLCGAVGKALWKTDEFGTLQKGVSKLTSSVATDEDLGELMAILGSGEITDDMDSLYAENYRFFEETVDTYIGLHSAEFKYLVTRLLRNVILLPIESEDRDSALRIFSTLNNRGLPLSDSDIFKATMYEHYRNLDRSEEFDERWKNLEQNIGGPLSESDSPMTELFRLYMGYLRGLTETRATNRPAVRDYFTREQSALLKNEKTLSDLEELAGFWRRYEDEVGFSDDVLKDLLVLKFAPNKLWQDAVSNYYLINRGEDGRLDQEAFHTYLQKMIAFIYGAVAEGANGAWVTRAVDREARYLGGNTLEPAFEGLTRSAVRDALLNLSPKKRINRGILAWWMMSNSEQAPFPLDTEFDVEHIYARKRHRNHPGEITDDQLESLGNKSLLEKRVNIRAADYSFADKRDIYLGKVPGKSGTEVQELCALADEQDAFASDEIDRRQAEIVDGFMRFLEENGVLAGD